MNPLLALNQCDQFVWLDYISRSLIMSGVLQRLIKEDGRRGDQQSHDFDKAIAGSADYDAGLHRALDAEPNISNRAFVERLIVKDIQLAADVLRPVYDAATAQTVSSVSKSRQPPPRHSRHRRRSPASLAGRGATNVMIKVPATKRVFRRLRP